MNKKKVIKILIIISVIIIIAGILIGRSVTLEVKESGMPKENVYFDGSDVTELSKGFVKIGSTLIGIVIGIYFAIVVIAIWIIYGIIVLIIKIVNKIKERHIK